MKYSFSDKINLLFRKLTGISGPEEEKELDGLYKEVPAYRDLYRELCDVQQMRHRREMLSGIDVEQELLRAIDRKKTIVRHLTWFKVSAVLFILLSGGVLFFNKQWKMEIKDQAGVQWQPVPGSSGALLVLSNGSVCPLSERKDDISEQDGSCIRKDSAGLDYSALAGKGGEELIYNKLLVGRGREYMLVLSDGTKVWMNSETELHYPVKFGKCERRVRFSGEAYFEVTHDTERPFIIDVNKGFAVKVLGTRFNIKAYPEDNNTETTLLEGKVEVNWKEHNGIILGPSQQLVLSESEEPVVREVNAAYYTAWHEGWFFFDNEPFGNVLKLLGRWYDVEFVCQDPEILKIKMSGKLKRFEHFRMILEMIEKTKDVVFDQQGGIITVKKNNRG